jgi:chemotaxis protein MotB
MRIGKRKIVVLLALGVAASTGCVTSGTYEELEKQHQAATAENERLAQEVDLLQSENAALTSAVAAAQSKVAALNQTHDQLVAELQAEVASGQIEIQQLVDGVRLNVSDELLFPSGGVELNDAGRALIVRVAGQLKSERSTIFVEGHTDNVRIGKSLRARYPTNWELAGARASMVVRVLSEAGIDPTRMRSVSRGPFAPIASNETEEGRARNRRTEIILRSLPATAQGG